VENIMSSKLFTTRQGTVLLGVIAAIIAAIALLVYLNHYRNSVNAKTVPVSVLVAQKVILKGTPGDVIRTTPGYYKPTDIAKGNVENGAITDPASLSGKVATTDISPGQQLTSSDFGAASNSITNQLGRNDRGIVVNLNSPQQVGGQLAAGDHVDVWVAFNGQLSNGISRPIVHELFQNMQVLNASTGSGSGNVTLKATPTEAGSLIYASENAQIWLVLRPAVGTTQPKPPTIGVGNLLGGRSVRIGG
jgi:pilus assembly protein CpaB